MGKEDNNRSEWLHIRLTADEYKTIHNAFLKTTCRKRCEYIRNMLLGKPIVLLHRDKSMDDALEELIFLRKELNFFGNNFNQAVRKLNSVSGMPEAKVWQSMLEVLRDQIEPSMAEIKERISNYSDLWSQKLSAEKA
jgi:hypothetical protein